MCVREPTTNALEMLLSLKLKMMTINRIARALPPMEFDHREYLNTWMESNGIMARCTGDGRPNALTIDIFPVLLFVIIHICALCSRLEKFHLYTTSCRVEFYYHIPIMWLPRHGSARIECETHFDNKLCSKLTSVGTNHLHIVFIQMLDQNLFGSTGDEWLFSLLHAIYNS